jgi:clan AA aspartic protease (TIGR02281 family)
VEIPLRKCYRLNGFLSGTTCRSAFIHVVRCIMNGRRFLVLLLVGIIFSSAATASCAETGREARFIQQGNLDLSRGAYAEAVEAFKQAVRLNASAKEGYAGLGLAYLKLGANEVMTNPNLLEKGVDAFHAALKLDPDLAEVRRNLGLAELAIGNREEALNEVRCLQKLDPRLAAELEAAVAARRPSPEYREIGVTGGTGRSTTGISIQRNAVLVPVTLSRGAQSTQALLILDTGASVTTISPEIAARLGVRLDRAPAGKIQVVGGSTVEARAVRLDRVTVGPHSKKGMKVAVIDNNGPFMQFDGLLGMDFLREFRYHIDIKNRLIDWSP